MNKHGLEIVSLLVIGAMLGLSGCGGSGSDGKPLTKAEFAAKANALCTDFDTAIKGAKAKYRDTIQGAIDFGTVWLPLYRKRVEGLDKLKPPVSEEASVKRIVALGNEHLSRGEKLLAALKKGDMTVANKLIAEGNAANRERMALFTELGITECLRGEE